MGLKVQVRRKPHRKPAGKAKPAWWDSPEYTDKDVIGLVQLYNGFCFSEGKDAFNGAVRLQEQHPGDLRKREWYPDAVRTLKLIAATGAKPREFIQAQFVEYRPPTRFSRATPTIKSMSVPAAVDRWKAFLKTLKRELPEAHVITDVDLISFSQARMRRIIETRHLENEEAFFKNPMLVSEMSKAFLRQHPIYQALVHDHYYEQVFQYAPVSA